MRVSEQLDMAADLIEQRGWGQGPVGWGREEGSPLCLEGGLVAALGLPREHNARAALYRGCPAYDAVARYLGMDERPWDRGPMFDGEGFLWNWNDAEGRTAAEVVGVLRAASAVESARESVSVLRMGSVAVQVGGAA